MPSEEAAFSQEDVSVDDAIPTFDSLDGQADSIDKETASVSIPAHRYSPLKKSWPSIYQPLVTHLKLDVRFNTRRRTVEMRTNQHTTDPIAIQKATDFIKAFVYGFDVSDALVLLRREDIVIEHFDIEEVKNLKEQHLARAIGRLAGTGGKVKFMIENATRTRITIADHRIYVMGAMRSVRIARDACVDLVLGAPPAKVHAKLRTLASRLSRA
jgi:RNA-binding protein PNO1